MQKSELLLDALLVFGAASVAVGGVLALTRDVLKQLLAYSTISQYGYVVFMYGLGGKYGVAGASFYVIAHALSKSALFLTAGAVTEATGEDRLSRLGGLSKPLPLLAVASGLAAASLAALPVTIGFFKDELFFAAALERGFLFAGLAVASAALTFAYIWRFWSGIFLGEPNDGASRIPVALVAPVVALGALAILGGILVGPFERLAEAAGEVSFVAPTLVDPAYRLDARPENLMALAAYALGATVVLSRPIWSQAALGLSRLGERAGPERMYELTVSGLNRFSDWIHQVEVRDLRSRVAAILLPSGILMGAGLLVTPTVGAYRVGGFRVEDAPLLLALLAVAVASLAAIFTRRHVTLALVLSSAGFVLAVVYAFYGAPDVALVAVLVETILTVLFIATLRLIPYKVLHDQAEIPVQRWRRKAFISLVAGAFAFAVVWGALSQPAAERSVAQEHLRLTPAAHAKDAVTAILADFRGLDTLGEITVVALVILGVATLFSWTPPAVRNERTGTTRGATSIMTRTVARLLLLPTFLTAAAILVKGYVDPGDGFSAGVVGALGVLLQYLAFGREEAERLPLVRHAVSVAFVGLLVSLSVAVAPLFLGDAILTHRPGPEAEVVHIGTLELLTAVVFDIGVFLLVFGFAVGVVTFFANAIAGASEHAGPGEDAGDGTEAQAGKKR